MSHPGFFTASSHLTSLFLNPNYFGLFLYAFDVIGKGSSPYLASDIKLIYAK